MSDKEGIKELKSRRSIHLAELRPDHPPTGFLISLIHLLKGVIGIGLFAMGNAFKNGGMYVSPPLVLLLGIIAVHCQHLLIKCAVKVTDEYQRENDPVDYAIAMELCFKLAAGKWVIHAEKIGIVVNICICITQFGFCCAYLIFISTNMQQVLENNGIKFELRLLILIVWLPIWLACLITNLRALAPVSFIANVLIFGSFFATIIFAYVTGSPDIDERKPYTTLWQMALFLGTVIFAYETIAVVLPVRNVMRKPTDYEKPFGVLNIGMSIIFAIYMLSGVTGYLIWGENVGDSLTLNLGDTILAQCVKGAVSLGIMFTYPLHFYVPIQVLVPGFLRRTHLTNRPLLGELLCRTLMTILTVIIAEIVPNVGLFISLIGALCSTALALVFPPVSELLLLPLSSHSKIVIFLLKFKNSLILLLAFISFTTGTTITIIEIVKTHTIDSS